ncbi:MAG: hypothetical protein JSR82_15870 [Verrucomicrobia bacterium]|nr:hypothetical protein [Verrucomicrobiota bacterium]
MSRPKPLWSRVYTRAVWWWERRFVPRLRERIWTLPPPTGRAPHAGCQLTMFAAPGSLTDAAWAARSLLRQLPSFELFLALDGSAAQVATARDRLPTAVGPAEVAAAEECVAVCRPRLAAFARQNAMGRKLAVVTARQRTSAVLYADSDVLAFGPLPEIDAASAERRARHIQCVEGTCLDPLLAARASALGRPLAPSLNGGFYFIPQGSFDEDLVERLLEGVDLAGVGWFGETVLTAVLLQALGSEPLPRERYVVSVQRQFVDETDVDYDRIALRHFVTPVRPLFYRRGLPRLWAAWNRP